MVVMVLPLLTILARQVIRVVRCSSRFHAKYCVSISNVSPVTVPNNDFLQSDIWASLSVGKFAASCVCKRFELLTIPQPAMYDRI